jgi:hypothetical protein
MTLRLIEGAEAQLLSFLTLALGGCQRSTSHADRLTPGKEDRHLVNRRVGGPQNLSGRLWEEINLLSLPGFEPP